MRPWSSLNSLVMIVEGTWVRRRLSDILFCTVVSPPVKTRSPSGSTGCEPRGENSFQMVGTGRDGKVGIAGGSLAAETVEDRYDANGTRLRSLTVLLISTGDPISSS